MDASQLDHDDIEFDRLVDGELSAEERHNLLASLDGRADGWRRLALAFLEAQSWRGELGRLIQQPAAPTAIVTALQTARRRGGRGASLLATAAAVMAAFGLGWQLSSPRADDLTGEVDLVADAEPVGETLDADAGLVDEQRDEALDGGDAVTLVVQNRHGVAQRVEVPLVDGARLGEQFAESPSWADPEFRAQLARQGIDLQARRRYAPLFFEQEDQLVPMVVPVDDAKITPVSLPIY